MVKTHLQQSHNDNVFLFNEKSFFKTHIKFMGWGWVIDVQFVCFNDSSDTLDE